MEKFSSANPYNPNTKKTPSKKTIITLVLFTLVFLIMKLACGSDEKDSVKIKSYSKEDALAHSHVYIESKLISPGTAKFNYNTEGVKQINDTIFTVSSYVDSENKFGALLRNKYSCKIIFHPKKDTHDVINAVIY